VVEQWWSEWCVGLNGERCWCVADVKGVPLLTEPPRLTLVNQVRVTYVIVAHLFTYYKIVQTVKKIKYECNPFYKRSHTHTNTRKIKSTITDTDKLK